MCKKHLKMKKNQQQKKLIKKINKKNQQIKIKEKLPSTKNPC